MLLLLLQRVVKLEVAAALQSPPIGGRDTEMLVLTHTHTLLLAHNRTMVVVDTQKM